MRNILLKVAGIGLMVFTLNAQADILLWGFKTLSFTDEAAKVTANQAKNTATHNASSQSSSIGFIKVTDKVPPTTQEQSKASEQQRTISELDFKIRLNNNVTYQDLVTRKLLNQTDLESLQQSGEICSSKDLISLEKFQVITKLLTSKSKSIHSNICPENYRPSQRDEKMSVLDNPCLTTSTIP